MGKEEWVGPSCRKKKEEEVFLSKETIPASLFSWYWYTQLTKRPAVAVTGRQTDKTVAKASNSYTLRRIHNALAFRKLHRKLSIPCTVREAHFINSMSCHSNT